MELGGRALNSDEALVEILLRGGALVNSQQECGKTPLYIACDMASKLIKILIENGADINIADKNDHTPLHLLASYGRIKMVDLLLSKGANINAVNRWGFTPLHEAAFWGSNKIVQLLIAHGATVNVQTKHGDTPLHRAVNGYSSKSVKALLANHADVNITNNENSTPYADFVRSLEEYPRNNIADDPAEFNLFATAKMFTRHLAAMKVMGLEISNENLLAMKNKTVAKYSLQCEEEMVGIYSEKIANSNVTLCDILMGDEKVIEGYLRNEDILEVLQSGQYKVKFPAYAHELSRNIENALEWKNFLAKGTTAFLLLIKDLPDLPDGCVEHIFTFLSSEDLDALMEASDLE